MGSSRAMDAEVLEGNACGVKHGGPETRRFLEKGASLGQETLSLPFIHAHPEKCLVGVSLVRMPSNKLPPKTLRVSVPPSLRVLRRRRFPASLPPPILKGKQ